MTLEVADPVKGEVRLCAQMCDTCIFRPGNLMRLRPGRLADLVRSARADHGHITCHDTLGDDVPGAICRGYADAYPGEIMALRVAAMFGRVVEV
jgi:hypothetical protein